MKLVQKLIRDRVPDRLRGKSEVVRCRRAKEAEFPRLIGDKIVEEANEVRTAIRKSREDLIGEIADVQEVISEIMTLAKISPGEVAHAQEQKRKERGGFRERWILYVE